MSIKETAPQHRERPAWPLRSHTGRLASRDLFSWGQRGLHPTPQQKAGGRKGSKAEGRRGREDLGSGEPLARRRAAGALGGTSGCLGAGSQPRGKRGSSLHQCCYLAQHIQGTHGGLCLRDPRRVFPSLWELVSAGIAQSPPPPHWSSCVLGVAVAVSIPAAGPGHQCTELGSGHSRSSSGLHAGACAPNTQVHLQEHTVLGSRPSSALPCILRPPCPTLQKSHAVV